MIDGAKDPKVRAAIAQELGQIAQRRHLHNLGAAPPAEPTPPPDARLYENAAKQEMVGLTFSGGGIRSATFCLGVLQGLAELGLLRYFDYLSTVSGGGYIGGWFTAWVRRSAGGLTAVEQQLKPSRLPQATTPAPTAPRGDATEPPPIFHLRRFSNYLSPRLGLLSADVWVLWATYLRNLLVCQLVLLPATVGVLLISRLFLLLYHTETPRFIADTLRPKSWDTDQFIETELWVLGGVILLLWFIAAVGAFLGSGWVRPPDAPAKDPADKKRLTSRGLIGLVIVPVFLTAILFSCIPALRIYQANNAPVPEDDDCLVHDGRLVLGLPGYPVDKVGAAAPDDGAFNWKAFANYLGVPPSVRNVFLCFALAPAILVLVAYLIALPFHRSRRDVLIHLFWAFVACVIGGIELYFVNEFLTWLCAPGPTDLSDYVHARAAARVTTFGPPLVVGVIVLTMYVGVAMLRNRLGEEMREWWSSLCAWLMIFAALWMLVNALALYAAAAVLWVGPWAKTALASGWLVTVLGGVLAGGTGRTDALKQRNTLLDWVARLAPSVFVAGLLISLAVALHTVLDSPPSWERGLDTAEWMRRAEPPHPPVRLSQTVADRTETPEPPAKDGPAPHHVEVRERKEVMEGQRVFDEPTVIDRVYWLSMFNTNPNFVPRPLYILIRDDVRYLESKRGLKDEPLQTLRQLVETEPAVDTPEAFKQQYRKVLDQLPTASKAKPGEVTKEDIIQSATDADLIAFNPGLLFIKLGVALLVCGGLFALAAFRVDVNLFSLHALYGNRLTRCYLGASHTQASPDPITRLDLGDDLKLADLQLKTGGPNATGYDGPFWLVNTALNLVSGDELAWQERKAESFTLSPLLCGSRDTGYCETTRYAGGLAVSTAITISGAAASPNAGYHSSPAVTALLTVFNARLGAWLGNPLCKASWADRSPRGGFVYLFKELFGRTTSDSAYIYLSDGGHFENLGAYELVRRRCRFIVIADAGCDGKYIFEDLGNLIRKCRIDFGIPIEIDLTAIRCAAQGEPVRAHCVTGTIHYEEVDTGADCGTLVYLKPSLSGDEPVDVLQYAAQHREFPHETTANQFFTESQFESYRALGQHIAEAVFRGASDDAKSTIQKTSPPVKDLRQDFCRALFAALADKKRTVPGAVPNP